MTENNSNEVAQDNLQHDHGAHEEHRDHSGHRAHRTPAELDSAYTLAFDSAVPLPGRAVVSVELKASEFDWEFSPGVVTRVWGFNGSVPGPTIEAHVGDVLEIRLTNNLDEPTAVHWHGLRVPAAMDGTDMVQRPVKPLETFTYRFVVPDAGTFWYHPHVNEAVQMERGLYGAMVIRADDEPVFDAERVLVFDDVQLDGKGQIKPPGGWKESHNGRVGDTLLLNGRPEPTLQIAAGQIERWRFVNSASARYIRLSIGGRPFTIVGTDGGLIAEPYTTQEVLIAPADRVDIAVGPFAEGETILLESLKYSRGAFEIPERELFATIVVGQAAASRTVIPARLRTIQTLVTGPHEPTRVVELGWRLSLAHGVDFTINKETHHHAESCKVGELQIWEIVNGSPVDHPFHLHGFFFQVVEVNGAPPDFMSWEDTVNIPARGRVRIAWIPDDRPGEWMYHCHILEHHAAGMMAHFDVVK